MVSILRSRALWSRIAFICCGGLLLFNISRHIIEKNYQISHTLKRVTSINNEKTEAILKLVDRQEHNIKKLLEQPEIMPFLEQLLEQTTKTDASVSEKFNTLLNSYRNLLSYKNFLIFTPQGSIAFTDTPNYANVSLEQPNFKNSALGQALTQTTMTLTTNVADFSYDPFLKQPAFFITIPIFKNKKFYALAAIRLHEQEIYDIVNNYIGLGATGEILITKATTTGIMFLNQIRSEGIAPFKKFLPFSYAQKESDLPPTQQAPLGIEGARVIADFRDILGVSAWQYVPNVAWGITTKIDYEEVLNPLHKVNRRFYYFLFFTFLSFCMALAYDPRFYSRMASITTYIKNARKNKSYYFLIALWLISLLGAGGSIYHLYAVEKNKLEDTHTKIKTQITHAKEEIDRITNTVELITQSLVYDLGLNRLTKEDLLARLEQELNEHPEITGISVSYAPYAYDKNKKLFSRYMIRTSEGITTFNLDERYDYATPREGGSALKAFYLETLKQKGLVWLDPFFEELSKQFVAPCSQDFHVDAHNEKELLGVVTVFLNMDVIKQIAESLNISTNGYAYLLSSKGVFIYHPQFDYQHEEITMTELAQKLGAPELVEISKKEQQNLEGFYTFYDERSDETKEVYFTPIEKADWSLGVIFSQKDVMPSVTTIRQNKIKVVFFLLFFLICTLILLLELYQGKKSIKPYVLTFPLVLCQAALLYLAINYSTPETSSQTSITDPVSLNRFVEEQKIITGIIHEQQPITLPTGIEIDSITITHNEGIKFSGFIWQKYDDILHKGISREVLFSQASHKAELIKLYETKVGTKTIIGWKFYLQIAYEFNDTQYPLDTNYLSILLDHPDTSQNILLVPEFSDYQNMNPEALPGIQPFLKLSGFNIVSSQFSFQKAPLQTTYGVEAFKESPKIDLHFDIVIVRDILYALLAFFLPIFIILFAIYATFILSESPNFELYKALTGYTGILLTLIFLHRMLREAHMTGTIMYIEYFFFLAYVTLLMLVIHVLLREFHFTRRLWYTELISYYKKYFWDIQLALSIIITTIIFY